MLSFKQFLVENSIVDKLKETARGTNLPGNDKSNNLKNNILAHAHLDNVMTSHVKQRYNGKMQAGGYARLASVQGAMHNAPHLKEFFQTFPTDHIIDKLAEGDPSKDKKHLPQLVNWYSKGGFRAEDLGSAESHEQHKNWQTVHGTLSAFSDIKNKDLLPDIPHPDENKRRAGQMLKGTRISSYSHMSFPDFRDHVLTHVGLKQASDISKLPKHPDIHFLGEHEGTKLYHLGSESGAKHAAKCAGADWCTGWEGEDNRFNHYDPHGPIYLAHHSDGTTHQIHLQRHEFMDKKNDPVAPEKLAEQYPGLKKFVQLKNYMPRKSFNMPFADDHTKHRNAEKALSILKTSNSTTSGGYARNTAIVANNGNHEQLKQLHDQITPNENRYDLRAHHHLALYRRSKEFGEDLIPYHGEKGTPEHLANLYDKHQLYDNIKHNHLTADSLKHIKDKHDELDKEYHTHFGHLTNGKHSLYTSMKFYEYGGPFSAGLHNFSTSLEKAKAFINFSKTNIKPK